MPIWHQLFKYRFALWYKFDMEKSVVGARGEVLAASFLKKNGYLVLDTNWHVTGGEIDIVSRAPDGTLVFCEVKTLLGNPLGLAPEDNLTRAKLTKMRRAAELYLMYHRDTMKEVAGWRMDVVTVVMGESPEVRHYENVS